MDTMHRIIAEERETLACSGCGQVDSFEGTTKEAAQKAAAAGWRRAVGSNQLLCPSCMGRAGSRQQRRHADAVAKRAAKKAALARP